MQARNRGNITVAKTLLQLLQRPSASPCKALQAACLTVHQLCSFANERVEITRLLVEVDQDSKLRVLLCRTGAPDNSSGMR